MFSRHSLMPLLGGGLLVSLLAGCAVGPDYQRPDAPLARHFSGPSGLGRADAINAAAAVTDDAAVDPQLADWWNAFGDGLLARYVTEALAQNLDLAQASARVMQARASLGAANAALLPSATVSSSAARAHQSVQTPIGKLLDATPGYNRWGSAYDANLNASWEVDVFGGLRRAREAALADYQASDAGLMATRLGVAAQTADVYITIRGVQARLAIAREQVKTQQDLLEKVSLLQSRGLAAQFQVDQAQAALAQVQASLPVFQAGLDAAQNALDVMLGTPPGTHRDELAQVGTIPVAPRIAGMGTPAQLLQRRPDLIAAERRLAASNARIGVAMAEYYPHFSLGALLGSATTVSAGNLFAGGASQAQGVLGLRWRLFDFGRINAQIDQAKGQQAEALATYRLAVLHATEDVENAFSSMLNRGEQAGTLARGEDALTRARQSSYVAYQRGAASLIDVLHADESLLRVADARAQAQADVARAAVAAYKALGGGWAPEAAAPQAAHQDGSPMLSALGHSAM